MWLAVVGNPGSRRVSLLTAAAQRAGVPAPVVLPWLSVLHGNPLRFPEGSLVRVESPGEDAEVDRLLRGAAKPAQHGEIVGGAAWFAGLSSALDTIATAATACGARLLADPEDIRIMFDKAACHAHLTAAGIPVPPALVPAPAPKSPSIAVGSTARSSGSTGLRQQAGATGRVLLGDWAGVRDALAAAGWRRVFLKPRHGSSASGVIALEFGGNGQVQATTSVELDDGKLFNSLRVRRYRDEALIAAIVDRLAPDGLHAERWFPKAGLDGHVVDLRVVVLNGHPSHIVVRGSKSPMTNLHLGGKRLDLSRLRAAAGDAAYEAGLETCERVAAVFPRTSQLGVDLMFGTGWNRHAVAEVNAFGDLLPGLLVNGLDTYEAQLRHLLVTAT